MGNEGGDSMAEPVEKARRQATIAERIEEEFQRAVGGIPAIERVAPHQTVV